MSDSTALISIIIPVYNAEDYIQLCLDSVLSQTYVHLEVICVNDGSTDRSLEIVKAIANNDDRIHVVDQPNQGVSDARNNGLSHATGSYVMFVDADDWIDKDCIEQLQVFIQSDCDIVMFPYISEYPEKSIKREIFKDQVLLFKGDELKKLARRMIGPIGDEIQDPTDLDRYGSVWGKLYRKSLASSTKFVSLALIGSAEDSLYNVSVFKNAKSVAYTNKTFYHYRKSNANSITSKHRSDLVEKWKTQYEYIRKCCVTDIEIEALQNRIAINILGAALNAYESCSKNIALKTLLNDELYHDSLVRLPLEYLRIHWKLFYYCARKRMVWAISCIIWVIKKFR